MNVQKPTPEDMEVDLRHALQIMTCVNDDAVDKSWALACARRTIYAEAMLEESVAVLRELREWYDRDGSVGGLEDPIHAAAALIAKVDGGG